MFLVAQSGSYVSKLLVVNLRLLYFSDNFHCGKASWKLSSILDTMVLLVFLSCLCP